MAKIILLTGLVNIYNAEVFVKLYWLLVAGYWFQIQPSFCLNTLYKHLNLSVHYHITTLPNYHIPCQLFNLLTTLQKVFCR